MSKYKGTNPTFAPLSYFNCSSVKPRVCHVNTHTSVSFDTAATFLKLDSTDLGTCGIILISASSILLPKPRLSLMTPLII